MKKMFVLLVAVVFTGAAAMAQQDTGSRWNSGNNGYNRTDTIPGRSGRSDSSWNNGNRNNNDKMKNKDKRKNSGWPDSSYRRDSLRKAD